MHSETPKHYASSLRGEDEWQMAVDGIRNAQRDVEHQLVAGSDDLGEDSQGVEAHFDGFPSDMDVDID